VWLLWGRTTAPRLGLRAGLRLCQLMRLLSWFCLRPRFRLLSWFWLLTWLRLLARLGFWPWIVRFRRRFRPRIRLRPLVLVSPWTRSGAFVLVCSRIGSRTLIVRWWACRVVWLRVRVLILICPRIWCWVFVVRRWMWWIIRLSVGPLVLVCPRIGRRTFIIGRWPSCVIWLYVRSGFVIARGLPIVFGPRRVVVRRPGGIAVRSTRRWIIGRSRGRRLHPTPTENGWLWCCCDVGLPMINGRL